MLPAAPLAAQQPLPTVRPLGPVTKVSPTGLLGSVTSVRPLPDGGAIVNDLTRRQLIVLDSTFTLKSVIADTTPATANSYSSRLAGLIAFRGDSSLLFRQGAVRADAEGNLWVRTTTRSDAGPIYDVIDGTGVLVDRVKLPFGRVFFGFGKGVV